MRFMSRTILAFVVLLFAAGSAMADQVVYFKSGRVIVASSVEERGGWVFIEFLGGGVLGVPGVKVDRVEESDLVSQATASVANTIQAPDASNRTSGGRTTPQGRPFRPDAGDDPGGGRRPLPNSLPGGNRLNRGGGPVTPQMNPAQFGGQGTDLSGNVGQPPKNTDDKKDDE